MNDKRRKEIRQTIEQIERLRKKIAGLYKSKGRMLYPSIFRSEMYSIHRVIDDLYSTERYYIDKCGEYYMKSYNHATMEAAEGSLAMASTKSEEFIKLMDVINKNRDCNDKDIAEMEKLTEAIIDELYCAIEF